MRVSSARNGNRLRIEIADDGLDGPPPACTKPGEKRPGIGLANTRAQLDTLYGADYRLELTKRPAGGTVVILDLPWRPAPAQPTS